MPEKSSIDPVKKIWGSPDCIMLIFAGSAAEFATNNSVDWLFYTGKIPADPINRFFETVRFAQMLFFSGEEGFSKTVERINLIHKQVENSRGMEIPQWAYRDVLFMLLDYSERAHRIVFGELSREEKEIIFNSSFQFGKQMHIQGLPNNYDVYLEMRKKQLGENYSNSEFTKMLYKRYEEELGVARFRILLKLQASLVPEEIKKLLGVKENKILSRILAEYRSIPGGGNKLKMFHDVILPARFKGRLRELIINN
jgi:hypothetical protein